MSPECTRLSVVPSDPVADQSLPYALIQNAIAVFITPTARLMRGHTAVDCQLRTLRSTPANQSQLGQTADGPPIVRADSQLDGFSHPQFRSSQSAMTLETSLDRRSPLCVLSWADNLVTNFRPFRDMPQPQSSYPQSMPRLAMLQRTQSAVTSSYVSCSAAAV